MIIAFNMSAVEDVNTVTGLGRHQLNIIKGLTELSLADHYVFIVNDAVESQLGTMYPGIRTYCYKKQFKLPEFFEKFYYFLNMIYLNQITVPRAIRHISPDAVFQPYNCMTIRTKWKKPSALMILDLNYKFFNRYMKKLKYRLVDSRHTAMMRDSDLLITSSTVNLGHIEKFFPGTSEKTSVVPVPIDIDTSKQTPFEIKKPYLLCVNSLRYHKNVHTLIKAFNLIKDRIEHNLVLTGTGENDEVDNIKNRSDRIIFTGYIKEEHRNYLYSEADLFISPTMFEGFGMTPLEAMLFKTKVLVSDIPVMRESTFGSCEYFDDIENEQVLASRILEVLEKEVSDEELENRKRQVLERYAPSRIAAMIHEDLVGMVKKNEDSY